MRSAAWYVELLGLQEVYDFVAPDGDYAEQWTAVLDTWDATGTTDAMVKAGETITVPGRSVLVLQKTG